MSHALRWELLGAAVGAGMASGREAASFFGRYGGWGFAAIPLACAVMAALAPAEFPPDWQARWPGRLRRALSALLLTATGGAMLCAAGETATRALPGSYPVALAATLVLSLLLARRTPDGLSRLSRLLTASLAAVLLLGLTAPLVAAVRLYLASLSTLTACLRCLPRSLPGIVLCALLGFTGAVEVLFPLLGGGCFLLLAVAKFTNSRRKAFQSRRDML